MKNRTGPGPAAGLLDLLFPPRCVFCRRLVGSGGAAGALCARCRTELPRTHGGGAERHGDFFALCAAPLYYEGAVRESLLRYKFEGRSAYAETYGPLLAVCVAERLAGRWDVLSWVPLSRKRLRERGYDQARLLAEAAGRTLGAVPAPVLEKHRDVPRQSAAGSAERRRANIAGAYRVPDPALVRGRRVLLVDDIVTTGATLSECARTLRAAGAAEVVCAALARTRDGA